MKNKDKLFDVASVLIAVLISLLLAFIIIFCVSKTPLAAIESLLLGPLTSVRNIGSVIELMTTLMFTGMAVAVMFQASQFNMGAEGAFFLGALAAAAVATRVILPAGLHPIICIIAGGIVGAIFCGIPAVLKAKLGASEMVSSLMLNYVALYLALFVLNSGLRDPNFGMLASDTFPKSAKLTQFIPKTRIHTGIFLAIALLVVLYFFLYKTKHGYDLRVMGKNPKFANYMGIGVPGVVITSQLIGGALAGIGGATEILGMYTRFQWTALPQYGWDGIVIAILARNKPQNIPLAALFLAYLRIGSDIMARMSDVPKELITVIQAIMIMLVTAQALLAGLKRRSVVKEAIANGNAG